MQITVNSLDEFIEIIDSEETGPFRDRIHYSIAEIQDQKSELKMEVVFDCSCIIDAGRDGQYLLQFGKSVGVDYHDGTGEKNGTYVAERYKKRLSELCQANKWKLLPGLVTI